MIVDGETARRASAADDLCELRHVPWRGAEIKLELSPASRRSVSVARTSVLPAHGNSQRRRHVGGRGQQVRLIVSPTRDLAGIIERAYDVLPYLNVDDEPEVIRDRVVVAGGAPARHLPQVVDRAGVTKSGIEVNHAG